MAITIIDTTTGYSKNFFGDVSQSTSIEIDKPTGQNNDLFVAVVGSIDRNTINPPSGWDLVLRKSDGDEADRQLLLYTKEIVNYSTEPSSYTWTQTNSEYWCGFITCLRGVDLDDIIDAIAGASDDRAENDSIDTPSIDINNSGSLVFSIPMLVANDGLNVFNPTYLNPPVGVTSFFDIGKTGRMWLASGYYYPSTGPTGTKSWPHDENDDVCDISMQVAFNCESGSSSSGDSCTNDCGSNQICTGNAPVCSNEYTFTSIVALDYIRASHLEELQIAIDDERVNGIRRFNSGEPDYCDTHTPGDIACSNNDFSGYLWTSGVVSGGTILRNHFNDIKEANNEVVNDSGFGSLVTTSFLAQSGSPSGSIIYATDITDLQTKINATRIACICDSHCNCDPSDCGCNGECPSHS